jgi:hypothetical protein
MLSSSMINRLSFTINHYYPNCMYKLMLAKKRMKDPLLFFLALLVKGCN